MGTAQHLLFTPILMTTCHLSYITVHWEKLFLHSCLLCCLFLCSIHGKQKDINKWLNFHQN